MRQTFVIGKKFKFQLVFEIERMKFLVFLIFFSECCSVNTELSNCKKRYFYKQVCIIYNIDSPTCTYGLSKDCFVVRRTFDTLCPVWACSVNKFLFNKIAYLLLTLNVSKHLLSFFNEFSILDF